MKRTFIIMLALGTVLALATPVAAKPGKGGGHGPSTHEYLLTMDGALATTEDCSGSGSIVMTGDLSSGLGADEVNLEMSIPIPWERTYDAGWGYGDEDGFTGCHGLSDSADAWDRFGGALWLTFLPGNRVQLHWLFDYYWEFETETRGKKTVQKQLALEFFDLMSTEIAYNPASTDPQSLTGTFTVRRFLKEYPDSQGTWSDVGTTKVSFVLQIEPAS